VVPYDATEIDFVVGYVMPCEAWFVIPVEADDREDVCERESEERDDGEVLGGLGVDDDEMDEWRVRRLDEPLAQALLDVILRDRLLLLGVFQAMAHLRNWVASRCSSSNCKPRPIAPQTLGSRSALWA
jgi:hypothetical protein